MYIKSHIMSEKTFIIKLTCSFPLAKNAYKGCHNKPKMRSGTNTETKPLSFD